MNEVPQKPREWALEKLGDFVVYQKGKKPKIINKFQTDKCRLPYINIKAFEKNIVDEYTDGDGSVLCEAGDFLMVWDGARSGYIGKSIKGALGSTLVKITFPGICLDYAYYFLQSKYLNINTKAKGTGIPHVDPNLLWNYGFPIPSLHEQNLIVSVIEELFSDLDNAVENLKNAREQLKVYRQSILKNAFEGKLTNRTLRQAQGTVIPAADTVNSSPVATVTEPVEVVEATKKGGELPATWKHVFITDLVEKNKHAIKAGPFGSSLKKEYYVSKGYKIYGQEQVISGDPFYGDYYISEDKYKELYSNKIKPFDVLISLVGTVGKVLILPENCIAGIINPRLIKVSLDRNIYLPKYFKYYFESASVKSFCCSKAQGTTMDVLNLSIIKTIPFPLCSVKEQQKIVAEIESRFSVCDQMEETIETSLKQAEALRQSILKQAFEGKLTEQWRKEHPDLISGENSAAALLAKIKAEKEALKKKK